MSQELINSTEMREDVTKRTACMKVFEHADHSFTAATLRHTGALHEGRPLGGDHNRLEAAEDEPPSDEDEIESEESTAMQSADSGDEGTGVKIHALDPQLTVKVRVRIPAAAMWRISQAASMSACPTR